MPTDKGCNRAKTHEACDGSATLSRGFEKTFRDDGSLEDMVSILD